jgi:predicted amidohydrolase
MALAIAGLQLAYPAGETRAARVKRVAALVADAPPADLLVLPELWDVAYFAFDEYERAAAPLDDGPVRVLAAVAARRRCTVVTGSVLERAGDQLFNTTAVVGPDGDLLGTYRKSHLLGYASREMALVSPGAGPEAVATAVGVIGLATCFDLRFPEHFTELRRKGADLFVVPAAWPQARADHWRVLVAARAIEGQTPIIAVNGVGLCHDVELAGASLVVDGRGALVTDAGHSDGWFVAELDPADTRAWRAEFPMHIVAPPPRPPS